MVAKGGCISGGMSRRCKDPYYAEGFRNPGNDPFRDKDAIAWKDVTEGWSPVGKPRFDSFAICERCGQLKEESRRRLSGLCVTCESETECRHRTSLMETCCKAGVNFEQLAGGRTGMMLRLPCFYVAGGTPVKCEKFEPQTVEEIEADDREMDESMARFMTVMPLVSEIKKEYKGKSWSGTRECPVCKGTLHLSHAAYNGHVHGKCETDGCVSWME